MTIIIKTTGIQQRYDSRKVYGSVYAACFVTGMNEERCAQIAAHISSTITTLLEKTYNKKEVTSSYISRRVTFELKKMNKEAAFMYSTHRDLG